MMDRIHDAIKSVTMFVESRLFLVDLEIGRSVVLPESIEGRSLKPIGFFSSKNESKSPTGEYNNLGT
ncbi:unnamed protein product [Mesocestoides corti]|uniref:Uncharacterized protein n=1 Tax=Mesocestoides corti TaxID=53468 RepID=A0A0R3UAU6_MESCO|nr:unnamed protein product [Mesocestoides corti]